VQANVVKVEEGKFKCGLCPKLFKGTDFVTKHVRTKHEENIQEIDDEGAFYNNYVQDPNHLLPPPPPPTLSGPLPTPAQLAAMGRGAPTFSPAFNPTFSPAFSPANLPMRAPLRPHFPLQTPLPIPVRAPQPFDAPAFGHIPGPHGAATGIRPRGPILPRPRQQLRAEVAENDPRTLRNYGELDDLPESSSLFDYRTEGLV